MPPCLPLPRPSSQTVVWNLSSHCFLLFERVSAGWFPAVPSIEITLWGVKGGKGRMQGISISVHNVWMTFVPCLTSLLSLVSLPFLCASLLDLVNQAEGRGEDLCHQGDRNLPPSCQPLCSWLWRDEFLGVQAHPSHLPKDSMETKCIWSTLPWPQLPCPSWGAGVLSSFLSAGTKAADPVESTVGRQLGSFVLPQSSLCCTH